MAERKVRGILTEAQGIKCKNIGCLLRSDFLKNSQCQPKALLDDHYPSTAPEREKRVKEDYGIQIPENCTLEYHKF
jgi:hypothetical protein